MTCIGHAVAACYMLQMQDHVGKAYTVHLPPNTHRTRGNTSFDCSCQIQRRWHIYTVYALFRHWPMIVYMGCIYTSTPDFSYTLYIHASTLAKGCIGERYSGIYRVTRRFPVDALTAISRMARGFDGDDLMKWCSTCSEASLNWAKTACLLNRKKMSLSV